MIREEKFLISKRPYAVQLDGLRTGVHSRSTDGSAYWSGRIRAVWFRRRSGVTMAVIGTLWDYQDSEPTSAVEFLQRHADGRYGGSWIARWNGKDYASEVPQPTEELLGHLSILRPMLDNYPDVPAGFDGWYRFETTEERRG